MMDTRTDTTKIELLIQEMGFLRGDVSDIKKSIQEQYVSKAEFNAMDARLKQLERYFYSFIGLIVVMVLAAIVGGVITK